MTEVFLVRGAGGVGKTTSSTALGLAFARAGRRTLLVSVDPARRLADIVEQPLGDDITIHKNVAALSLWMPGTSTELSRIAKQTMSAEEFRAFEANRVTELFHAAPAGLHEAACALSLGQIAEAYEVVVVDTAPFEQSTSFLEAPTRLRRLFEGHALALFSTFGSSRGLGQRVVERMLDRVLPAEVIAEGAEFFRSILGVRNKLAQRAARAEALLGEAQQVIVAAPDDAGVQSALMLRRTAMAKRTRRKPRKSVITILNRAARVDGDSATRRALRLLPDAVVLSLVDGPSRDVVDALSRQLAGALKALAPRHSAEQGRARAASA